MKQKQIKNNKDMIYVILNKCTQCIYLTIRQLSRYQMNDVLYTVSMNVHTWCCGCVACMRVCVYVRACVCTCVRVYVCACVLASN